MNQGSGKSARSGASDSLTRAATPPRGSARARVLRELREAWWIYLLAPAAITTMTADSFADPRHLWLVYRFNLLATLCLGGLAHGLFAVYGHGLNRRGLAPVWRWLLPIAIVVVSVLLGTELLLAALNLLQWQINPPPRVGVWIVGGTVTVALATIGLVTDRLRGERQRAELRSAHDQRARVSAQLEALRARLDPHFLFNGLNTVAALIPEDPEAAERAVEQLSMLLRRSLEHSLPDRVTLREELAYARAYLELERTRHGPRLALELEIPDALLGHPLPPFTLQPLLENAIKHGLGATLETTRITLRARLEGELLALEVHDDGPGVAAPAQPGAGTGHATLRQRLELLYGGRARLRAGPAPEGGYRARVELPRARPDETEGDAR